MGSIVKKKNGTYAIRYDVYTLDGTRKQKQKGGFTHKRDAQIALSDIENEILKGQYSFKADEMTFDDLFTEFLEDARITKKANTYASYHSIYENHIKDVLGRYKLSQLTRRIIEKKMIGQKAYAYRLVKMVLLKAEEWEYISISPAKKIKSPSENKIEMKFWNIDQINAALSYLKNEQEDFAPLVKFSLFTGCRKGELLGFREEDFDFENHTFTIRRQYGYSELDDNGKLVKSVTNLKTDSSQATLPLLPEAEAVVKASILRNKKMKLKMYAYHEENEGYVFKKNNGEMWSTPTLRYKWIKFLKEHPDLPQLRWHDLRHTFATWLVAKGVSMKVVQKLMRHSTFSMTADRYAHVSDNLLVDALNTISDTIKEA